MTDYKVMLQKAVDEDNGPEVKRIAHEIMDAGIELEDLFDENENQDVFNAVAKYMY